MVQDKKRVRHNLKTRYLTSTIVQKNTLFRKGIGIQNFSGPSSYSLKRNRNYSFIHIPLKGKEYLHIPEFQQNKEFLGDQIFFTLLIVKPKARISQGDVFQGDTNIL